MFKKFKEIQKKQKAYGYVMGIVGWDSNTEAPRDAFEHRAEMMGIISSEMFKLSTSKDYQEAVYSCFDNIDELDELQKREIKRAKKNLDKILKVPEDVFVEYRKTLTLAQRTWEEAKHKDDFEAFAPVLDNIIQQNKKILEFIGYKDIPYNELLDDFEEGYTEKDYDEFFETLKRDLVPFVKEVLTNGKKIREDFITDIYPRGKQKEFVEYLMKVLNFNYERGGLKESVHPFTWHTHSKDVRFTVRYLEDFVFSSIFAGIHELGHALYEQQIDPKLDSTNLGGGTSSGIHESQSRFYENIIGRSDEFWKVHYPKLKELFPEQLKTVTLEEFVLGINRVEASFVRVEADELTYPLHILMRYEIEKDLFGNRLETKDLPKVWNAKMVEYLGIEPKNFAEGVLQDVHWSAGLFGYFPTYALGSAYAAQFYYTMKKELNFEQLILDDNIKAINEWLKEKIHQFGSSKTPKELLKEVTNEDFNPQYYVKYLKEKYTKLYL